MVEKVIIMGAAGRDFHNFNVYFRDNPRYHVICFTATQIPDIDGRKILYGIGFFVILVVLFSSFYTIDTDEVGVIQRFGAFSRVTEPGLHFKLPWGIEKITKVKVQRVFKEEFGFRTITPGIRTEYSNADFSSESLMLTGDLNTALVEWIVQYRVKDPEAFLFNVRDVQGTLRDVSE